MTEEVFYNYTPDYFPRDESVNYHQRFFNIDNGYKLSVFSTENEIKKVFA